jgi:hypothetical protein
VLTERTSFLSAAAIPPPHMTTEQALEASRKGRAGMLVIGMQVDDGGLTLETQAPTRSYRVHDCPDLSRGGRGAVVRFPAFCKRAVSGSGAFLLLENDMAGCMERCWFETHHVEMGVRVSWHVMSAWAALLLVKFRSSAIAIPLVRKK